jgi:inhibitor of KinA
MPPLIELTSERSAAVRVHGTEQVASVTAALLRDGRFPNLHPAYSSVLVEWEPLRMAPEQALLALRAVCASTDLGVHIDGRSWEVPVRYGGEYGPDLADVAKHAQLSPREAAERHAGAGYIVAFLGFAPGFPYLRGLPPELSMPRLAQPRPRVPAGSVAIGGSHAGIYPFDSAGGWRIIGRTDLRLFDAGRQPPALFATGDRIHFVPVSWP